MIETQSCGGVVLNTKHEVVVVNQKGQSWSLPKGHVDPGEDEIMTAKREIYEESGISELVFVKKLATYKRYRHGSETSGELKKITMFLFTSDTEVLTPTDPENPEARWVAIDEVTDLLTYKEDKDFFESIKNELK